MWGFGFVATVWALPSFSIFQLLFLRFAIASLAGFAFVAIFRATGQAAGPPSTITSRQPQSCRDLLRQAVIPAGVLTLFMILQTWGLQSTSVTNSGFITTLYVVIVPLFNGIFHRWKIPYRTYFYIFLALSGTYILTGANFNEVRPGDLITLISSFLGAFHIIWIEKISRQIQDSFIFNNFQSLICALLFFPFSFIAPWSLSFTAKALFGVLFLAIGSSLLAFWIQIRAQKALDPVTASLLFLLESVFAFLFAIILLDETLAMHKFWGAFLILISASLCILAAQMKPEPKIQDH